METVKQEDRKTSDRETVDRETWRVGDGRRETGTQ